MKDFAAIDFETANWYRSSVKNQDFLTRISKTN